MVVCPARPSGADAGSLPWPAPGDLDETSAMSVRAHRVQVTEDDREILPSHSSAFEVTVAEGDERTPEQWARSVFEETPKMIRWFVVFGWRYVLGLQLGPSLSPAHLSGWRILNNESHLIILGVRSRLLTAHKYLRIVNGRVVMTTIVQYDRKAAKAVWTLVTPVHYRTEPYLLGYAASHPM
jgi:hypothetical protein